MAFDRWEISDTEWEDCFSILVRLHGGVVRRKRVIDGFKIGEWIEAQRNDYRNGKLSAERIARLEAIGFNWDNLDTHREECFAIWPQYEAILVQLHRYGKDVNVAQSVVINGFKIGEWIEAQRHAYKQDRLSAEQIASLEAIGFKWVLYKSKTEARKAAKFKKYCTILERHLRKGGSDNLPSDVVIFGAHIGGFVAKQRFLYSAGALSAERIAILESIGFRWQVRELNEEWVKHFAILEQHHREGGNINELVRGAVIAGAILHWIDYQRRLYKAGELSAFRIAELESIGFRWEVPDVA